MPVLGDVTNAPAAIEKRGDNILVEFLVGLEFEGGDPAIGPRFGQLGESVDGVGTESGDARGVHNATNQWRVAPKRLHGRPTANAAGSGDRRCVFSRPAVGCLNLRPRLRLHEVGMRL